LYDPSLLRNRSPSWLACTPNPVLGLLVEEGFILRLNAMQ
jgi:hypothetical protein